MFSKRLYIDGKLVSGESEHNIVNPANNEVVGTVAVAGLNDVEAALNSAARAFPIWANTSVAERVKWMGALRDAVIKNENHLRECVHLEMGKPWASTAEDYQMLVDSLDFYAQEILRMAPEDLADHEGTHKHILTRQPIGVAAAFLAWNFPLLNVAYKIGPALAAGCPIIIKPSIKTPLSAYAVGELCADIGLPAGVVTILAGVDREIGDAISRSTIPRLLTLIGSTQTGMHVMRTGATSIKRYSMELGGNAPAIVFADANLDTAADIICALKFSNAGQICVAPNRVMVEASVADAFTEKVVERARAVRVGFDKNADIHMGPLIDEGACKRIDALVQEAITKGAQLLHGGGRPEGLNTGSYYAPTVLSGVDESMTMYDEEIFGPVISLMTFTNQAEALTAANNTDAGLTAYIFTADSERADQCAAELDFGEIQINGVKYAINLPHGGIRQSGIGVDCSYLALEDYLAPKRITRALVN
ncbi:MAG: NAD-dependent succinate-semialdehyde dehydrogenase [Asticcacaulis sp.]